MSLKDEINRDMRNALLLGQALDKLFPRNPMDTFHPWPSKAQLRAEEDREDAREAEADARAKRLERIEGATKAWAALKNELAALIETEPSGGKSIRLAHLEDSDHHVLSILEDV